MPGVHVDVYDTAATVRFDGSGARAFYRELPRTAPCRGRAAGITLRTIVERRPRSGSGSGGERVSALRRRRAGRRDRGRRERPALRRRPGARAEGRAVPGSARQPRAGAHAGGGRSVLNLFGYTGGFSIYAAAGGARATVTVDAAAPAIAAARRNFARNGLAAGRAARFVAGDAFAFLEQAAAAGERFDLVISDPPSFAPSRRALPAGLGRTGGCTACARRSPRRAGRCARRRARATSIATRSSPPSATGRATPGRRFALRRGPRRRRRPSSCAALSGGELPEICGRYSMMRTRCR